MAVNLDEIDDLKRYRYRPPHPGADEKGWESAVIAKSYAVIVATFLQHTCSIIIRSAS